ncbi:potassium channel family protein [Paenibacillus hodogayensis]|uniref:Potassium channel family protein n=1 Tax=Paenibacillus hodogayensis TaxID=279208 RepID=A0ABV5VVZ6_9BACL
MISFALTLKRMLTGLIHAFKEKNFRTLFILTVMILLSGTLFYYRVEHFTVIDALFFSVMTLTTVGTAELAPHSDMGKLFTIVYTFAGIGIIFGFIYYIARGIHASSASRGKRPDPDA